MVTLLGVLKDTPMDYNLTHFEADRSNGLGVITNCNSLKDRVKHLISRFKKTGTFNRK